LTTVGVIGAGQLGQMLGGAARRLGLDCVFVDPSDRPPAATAGRVIQAAYDDIDALRALAAESDVITYEFENVPVAAVRELARTTDVFPPPDALECAQDRLIEKQLFQSLGIPVPDYAAIESDDDLKNAALRIGLPLVVKTRRLGYDGKGQAILRDLDDAARIVAELGGRDLIAEQFVKFDREVSSIGARSVAGTLAVYPLTENRHGDGILRVSRALADTGTLAQTAADYLERLMSELDYVGTLALELFVLGDGLLANEMAPRVHNSGHWTIEGATVSQFENHMRAVTGLPLAQPELIGYPGMINIIGDMPAERGAILADGGALHDYGKLPRPGRKLGHITVVGDSPEDRDRRIARMERELIDRN